MAGAPDSIALYADWRIIHPTKQPPAIGRNSRASSLFTATHKNSRFNFLLCFAKPCTNQYASICCRTLLTVLGSHYRHQFLKKTPITVLLPRYIAFVSTSTFFPYTLFTRTEPAPLKKRVFHFCPSQRQPPPV